MASLFDQFKQILVVAVSDAEFCKRNILLTNPDFRADVLARIDALSGETVRFFGFSDVATIEGGWTLDAEKQTVEFDPSSAQPENTITFNPQPLSVPMRIRDTWLRGNLPSSEDDSAPDAHVELSLDTSLPDAIALSSLQVRINLVLNGITPQAGWSFRELAVLLAQE